MLTPLKLTHLILPLFLGVVYIYFILLLNRYLYLSIALISVFVILLFFYALRAYALLHHKAKITKNLKQFRDLNTQKIFQYKRVEQNLKQLKNVLKTRTKHQNIDLYNEFVDFYQQLSYCDYCQCVKPSRAYHCFQCNACILRRQKHSQLTNYCIGQGNLKPFIQYMFIAMVTLFLIVKVTSCYMTISLIIITIGQHHQLNEFSTIQLLLFAFEQICLCSCLLLFIKQFAISYFNARHNITETQRKQNMFDVSNNPFNKQDFYHELFNSKIEYFKINNIGDYGQWLELYEES